MAPAVMRQLLAQEVSKILFPASYPEV